MTHQYSKIETNPTTFNQTLPNSLLFGYVVAGNKKRLRIVTINDAPYSFTNDELLDKDSGKCYEGLPCSTPRRIGQNETLVSELRS